MTVDTAETLDLSRLGAPHMVLVDFETIRTERLAHLGALWAAEQLRDPNLRDPELLIRSSSEAILTEEYAFADMLLRQALNDAADALRLATAAGADLRHLAKTYANTAPLVLDRGDPSASPPRPPVIEPDAELRERAQLAPEAFPEFGLTPGGYVYRVKRMFGDRVKGVRPRRRPGGYIDLIILGRAGNGTPAPSLIGDIQAAFDGEADSQSTDIVTVLPARIVPYTISGTLLVRSGPDRDAVRTAGLARLRRLTAERHQIAANLPLKLIVSAALGSPAVAEDLVLASPAVDIAGGPDGVPFCTGIQLATELLP